MVSDGIVHALYTKSERFRKAEISETLHGYLQHIKSNECKFAKYTKTEYTQRMNV